MQFSANNTGLINSNNQDAHNAHTIENRGRIPDFYTAENAHDQKAAQEAIDDIQGLHTLQAYLKQHPWSLGPSVGHSPDNRYYYGLYQEVGQLAERYELTYQRIFHLSQLKEGLERELKKATDEARTLHEDGTRAEQTLRKELPNIRVAIRSHQLKERKRTAEVVAKNQRLGIYQPGPRMPMHPRLPPKEPLKTNQYVVDQHHYRCPHCLKKAPGHNALQCPQYPILKNIPFDTGASSPLRTPPLKRTDSTIANPGTAPRILKSERPITKTLKETVWDPVSQSFKWPKETAGKDKEATGAGPKTVRFTKSPGTVEENSGGHKNKGKARAPTPKRRSPRLKNKKKDQDIEMDNGWDSDRQFDGDLFGDDGDHNMCT
ncbi:hypothetical protein EST38_g11822 [Candolleomyces aberdarensis]|uniref:Uncharacterized protein n=1 Tax=Candolleomyces aberdarensis TaxID=2316362 RepID=A0A4V1Q267_9AGAR|nr:hypothetical protein EST38_g11822 [Candolleomyces aberdarensis]